MDLILNLNFYRRSRYDKGGNMSGKTYQGVQMRLLEINEHAQFFPCAAHSVNLIGEHATSISIKVISFFGVVKSIFNFFRIKKLMRNFNDLFKNNFKNT